jgi:hypothetical protein
VVKFLDTYDHLILKQEDISHLYWSITHNEIEAAVKTLPKKKSPWPDGFATEFYQTFKEEIIATLHKIFHKIEREETLSNLFYEVITALFPKPDKDTSKIENYKPISSMDIDMMQKSTK